MYRKRRRAQQLKRYRPSQSAPFSNEGNHLICCDTSKHDTAFWVHRRLHLSQWVNQNGTPCCDSSFNLVTHTGENLPNRQRKRNNRNPKKTISRFSSLSMSTRVVKDRGKIYIFKKEEEEDFFAIYTSHSWDEVGGGPRRELISIGSSPYWSRKTTTSSTSFCKKRIWRICGIEDSGD